MRWEKRLPEAGDMVRTKVSFYHHYGVYLGDGRIAQFGRPVNTGIPREQIAVCITDTKGFLSEGGGAECAVLDREERKWRRPPKECVEYAKSCVGETGYDFINNNCEHFAYRCVFGVSYFRPRRTPCGRRSAKSCGERNKYAIS